MRDESSVSITAEAWEQALEAEFRAFMEETRAAMNAVREDRWIADTEELVRDAGERFRRRASEESLQLRVRARVWDIGSGPTEARYKTMTVRLKGSGMRWAPSNADAMLALTGLADSDEWPACWHN